MKDPENTPSTDPRKKRKGSQKKSGDNVLKMDAPGPAQHSSVDDDPAGIARNKSQPERQPITNQDEQEVITNQEQSLLDAEKN